MTAERRDRRSDMKHWYRFIAWVLAACLVGCAVSPFKQPIAHGFDVRSAGIDPVSDVVVHYGAFKRSFCDNGIPCRKGYAVFYGIYMPIQDSFTVTWKTPLGHEHRAVVNVRDRLIDPKRLHAFALQLDGSTIYVTQELRSINAWDVKLESAPLYP